VPDTIVGQYPPAKWEVPGASAITFPVMSLRESGGNRLVGHKRIYRDGERLDDTGNAATTYAFEVPFLNSPNHEEGVDGLNQYPDNVNALIAACKIHETGTLTVPTIGPRRCRAETWERVEQYDKVDMAMVRVTFREDSEDNASSAAAVSPSAQSVAAKYAKDAVDGLEELGATSLDMSELQAFASDLQSLATAPAELVGDIEAKVGNAVAAAENVAETFSSQAQAANDELATLATDPAASKPLLALAKLKDVVHGAIPAKHGQGKVIVTRTYDVELSIFAIATDLEQDPVKLMALNSHLPDLLAVEAGTPVKVFKGAA
jgi:DNA circularisation protein N-terminus